MKYIKSTTIVFFILLSGINFVIAQDSTVKDLPKAFQIGEYEEGYGNLIKLYPKSLLNTPWNTFPLPVSIVTLNNV